MYFPIKNRYNVRKLKEMIASFGQIQHATFLKKKRSGQTKHMTASVSFDIGWLH
jgi:hypothetical protein